MREASSPTATTRMKSISKLAFAIFFTRLSISVSVTRYLRDEQLQSGVATVFNCKALSRIIDGPTCSCRKSLDRPNGSGVKRCHPYRWAGPQSLLLELSLITSLNLVLDM